MAKKLTRVELHEGFFIPGLLAEAGGGQFGKTLPPANKSMPDLSMTMSSNGSVEVQWSVKGIKKAITIGAANVKYAEHSPTESNSDA